MIDFLERTREFVADVVAPNAARWEAERAYPRDAFKAAGEAGLCGLLVDPALGDPNPPEFI